MTEEFKRPTCHICNEKIERHEGHIGYPFVETPRHFKCSSKCEKCGLKVYDIPEHMQVCDGKPIDSMSRAALKAHLTGKSE